MLSLPTLQELEVVVETSSITMQTLVSGFIGIYFPLVLIQSHLQVKSWILAKEAIAIATPSQHIIVTQPTEMKLAALAALTLVMIQAQVTLVTQAQAIDLKEK